MAEVAYTDEFEAWWDSLDEADQDAVQFSVSLLRQFGVTLGHPRWVGENNIPDHFEYGKAGGTTSRDGHPGRGTRAGETRCRSARQGGNPAR